MPAPRWKRRSAGTMSLMDGGTERVTLDANGTLNGSRVGVETKTADYTLTAADSGKVFLAGAVDLVFTLPSTVSGLVYTIVVKTVSASTGCSVSPAAADQIVGNGFTVADDKDAINTAATDAVGDSITVVGDGSVGWYITNVAGTWARET